MIWSDSAGLKGDLCLVGEMIVGTAVVYQRWLGRMPLTLMSGETSSFSASKGINYSLSSLATILCDATGRIKAREVKAKGRFDE